MALDPIKNFAKVTVSTGYDSAATSITLNSGDGNKLPDPATDGAFNLVWWNATDYPDPSDDPNVEIVRVTAKSGDTLTITRGQEGTSAVDHNTSGKTYKMVLAVTEKTMSDINSTFLWLDQTSPQSIVNGSPLLQNTPTGTSDIKSIVNKEYVDNAVTALGASYYLHDDDDATGYKICYLEPSSSAETYIEATSLSDDDYIGGWISAPGEEPSVLLRGIYNWFVFAEKTAGTQTLRLYWKLYERKSDNSEVLIATSSNSNEVTTSKSSFVIPLELDNDYTPDSGSRIVGKMYADVSDTGSVPSVKIYYQGEGGSRWEIPANTEIFRNIFVPYSGAVKDIDLGTNNLVVDTSLLYVDATNDIIGIGTSSPSSSYKLTVDGGAVVSRNETNPASIYTNFRASAKITATSDGNYANRALLTTAYSDVSSGITNSGFVNALDAQAYAQGAGTTNGVVGIYSWAGYADSTGGGSLDGVDGIQVNIIADGGSVTNAYAIHINEPLIDNGGSITNSYGIYQAGSSTINYFAGSVGIGTSSPAEKLEVDGNIKASGAIIGSLDGILKASSGVVSGGAELNDLSDVNASSPSGGDVLTWDSGTSKWIASTPSGGGFNSRVRVYLSSDQSIAGQTTTKINFDTEDYDGNNEWDTSTYKFTAANAGYYLITCRLYWDTTFPNDQRFTIYIYKNGSNVSLQGWRYSSISTGSQMGHITDILYLAAGDTIEFYVYQGDTSAHSLRALSKGCFAAIHRLS